MGTSSVTLPTNRAQLCTKILIALKYLHSSCGYGVKTYCRKWIVHQFTVPTF